MRCSHIHQMHEGSYGPRSLTVCDLSLYTKETHEYPIKPSCSSLKFIEYLFWQKIIKILSDFNFPLHHSQLAGGFFADRHKLCNRLTSHSDQNFVAVGDRIHK